MEFSIVPAELGRNRNAKRNRGGFTLVELIVCFTIVALLATLAVPLARYKVRRERETDLRYALKTMREAVDRYKDACDRGDLGPPKLGKECYPDNLEMLVEGVEVGNSADEKKIRFLRRVPLDPFTRTREWGLRSTKDDPKSMSWSGDNVFDVYSKTMDKATDGTPYSEW
jgi:general secretion pathway protein G